MNSNDVKAEQIAQTILNTYHLDGTGTYSDESKPLIAKRYDSRYENQWNEKACSVRLDMDALSVFLEAPSHAIIEVFMPSVRSVTVSTLVKKVRASLRKFNPDRYFTALWSKDFAKKTGLRPIQLATALEKDKEFFNNVASKIDESTIENALKPKR